MRETRFFLGLQMVPCHTAVGLSAVEQHFQRKGDDQFLVRTESGDVGWLSHTDVYWWVAGGAPCSLLDAHMINCILRRPSSGQNTVKHPLFTINITQLSVH